MLPPRARFEWGRPVHVDVSLEGFPKAQETYAGACKAHMDMDIVSHDVSVPKLSHKCMFVIKTVRAQ